MKKRYFWDRSARDWVEKLPPGSAIQVAPTVWSDLPGYLSPCDSGWIEGRAARREDLKRHGCVEAGDIPPPGNGLLCESPGQPNYDAEYAKDYDRDRRERAGPRVLTGWPEGMRRPR